MNLIVILRVRIILFCLSFVFLGAFSWSVTAQSLDDFFPNQHTIYTAKNKNTAYPLALSPLKKINSEWISENERLILGSLQRKTVEVGRPFNLDSAWLYLQQQFEIYNASLLFECKGMDCGSSNAWANERFDVKQLYGLDLSQFYQVWQIYVSGSQQIAVAYLVQRGNKRIYFQLDWLAPKQQGLVFIPTEEVVAGELYRDNQVEIRGLSFSQGNIEIDQDYLKAYAKAVNQKPFRKLLIVGHDYHPGDEETQQSRSLTHAEAVIDALVAQGVQKQRMSAKGVGSLAPSKTSTQGRVVVLLK